MLAVRTNSRAVSIDFVDKATVNSVVTTITSLTANNKHTQAPCFECGELKETSSLTKCSFYIHIKSGQPITAEQYYCNNSLCSSSHFNHNHNSD